MIKINLAPSSELENPLWWLTDVIIILLVAALGSGAMALHFESIQDQVEALGVEKSKLDKDYADLSPKIAAFKDLTSLIKGVEDKQKSLNAVTSDYFTRYKPVLVLEIIQALKPKGAWINTIESRGEGETYTVSGVSFNNKILSEFISNLKSLSDQKIDPNDLRTSVNIENILLKESIVSDKDVGLFDGAKEFRDFEITFDVKKKAEDGATDEVAGTTVDEELQ